jgi:uncharacterized Zn-finger protein
MGYLYHIHEFNIKCPYCDKEYQDDDYEVAREFDSEVELECEYCGKKFWAESCIVYSTYADCALNGKSHDLIETHIAGQFKCNDCEHYEYRKGGDSNSGSTRE